ncbi:MAG TPA: aminotransferase class I/II-fold pyridoxal phosphate-dependent enzyme [Synergistaceae bacterium]|nr:aminotransferase class I/II-fold pyridoxal phosphate-dependent enzyme [Synergistaceae bacterium]HPJ24871.1 aminotransferase class I/II-fold pyridoxal phosphate-dependent enzyme [Synergistaceae bacterium]HPQ37094.1 aminotransferase class I/II-fold pyridoxal phosphate-dependent enzyme [Synergistaceae bacterium]
MWRNNLPFHLLEETRESYVTREHSQIHHTPELPLVDCALGTNPLGAPPEILAYLQEPQKWNPSGYPPSEAQILQEMLPSYLGDSVAPKDIVFGHGSIDVLLTLLRILLPPESVMGGISPQFTDIPLQAMLGRVLYHPELLSFPEMRLDRKVLARSLTRHIQLLYLDRPHNPTGQFISLEDLDEVCSLAKERDIWVLVDEAYADYLPPQEGAHTLKHPNLVITRSFSKCWGLAGIRGGYGIIRDADLLSVYRKLHPPFALSVPAVNLIGKALRHPEFLQKTRDYVNRAKLEILSRLREHPLLRIAATDPRTPIMMLHTARGNLWESFFRCGISTEPGDGYMHTDTRSVRLRVPPEKDLPRLLEILSSFREEHVIR